MSEMPAPPAHYAFAIEPLDAIEAWGLNFSRGNVVKYVARAGRKVGADEIDDLRKARVYLDREIRRLERADCTDCQRPHVATLAEEGCRCGGGSGG